MWLGSARRIVIGVVAVLALGLVLAGSRFERAGQRQDRSRFPQIGHSFDVGGHTLNLSCAGDGDPTVVFETASHQAGYSWMFIQRQVSAFARACWYDRAGYGWSEPSPQPHTSQTIAADLHRLLQAAAIRPPYVLVGEGLAGLHTRVYTGLYPTEVAGVVFINAEDVEVLDEPEFTKGPIAKHFGSWTPYVRGAACSTILPFASSVGLARLLSSGIGTRPTPSFGLTPTQQTELDALSDNQTANASGELCGLEESRKQVRSAGNFGDRPLIVLASARRMPFNPPDREEKRIVEDYNNAWVGRLQPRLAALSTRGRLLVVDDGPRSHVTQAVRDLLTEIRRK